MNLLARAALATEIVLDYARVRRGLARTNLPAVLADVRGIAPRERVVGTVQGARLARAVTLTLEALPLDSRCLMQSLVLLCVLSRRGVTGLLVIAVRPEDRGRLDAHAWVEVDGRPLLAPAGMQQGRLVTL